MSESPLSFVRPEQAQGSAGEIGLIVEGIVSRIQTVTLVRVVNTKAGGLAPVGMVDVQPLVSQINGAGQLTAHGIIYNVPYFRLQGGGNAVIIDPAPGDIGMCGFCSRDISSVKQNKAPSAPQSRRRFDFSDGLYFGGFLNGTPEQYIRFKDGGIKVFSPGDIELEAANIRLNAQGAVSSTSASFQANRPIQRRRGYPGRRRRGGRQHQPAKPRTRRRAARRRQHRQTAGRLKP